MYYYLSFLRPPPRTASVAEGAVVVTPQIANDLRTELKDDAPTDIYYVWQCLPATTRPIKLTTYNPPVNTYKPLTVPLPAQAKPGQTWRLGLFSPPATTVHGHLDTLAQHVCGVWSDGVKITPARSKTDTTNPQGAKQTRVFREWGLPAPTTGGKRDPVQERVLPPTPRLRIVEQTSFDLDKKIWDSGLALSAWLHQHLTHPYPRHPLIRTTLDRLLPAGHRRILELGAGTGLVSFALASALHRLGGDQSGEVDIYATDLESALPLIDENATLNSHLWAPPADPLSTGDADAPRVPKISIHARVLDWEQDLPSWVHTTAQGDPCAVDLVIAADVTYNTASFPALINTLSALLNPSTGPAPFLLLAYKERDPSERELWRMAEARGIWWEMVDVIRGHEVEGAGATEIWVAGGGERPGKG